MGTILTGLLSFMLENAPAAGTVSASKSERRRHAIHSLSYNCRNRTFCQLFPDYVDQHQQNQQAMVRLSFLFLVGCQGMISHQPGSLYDHLVMPLNGIGDLSETAALTLSGSTPKQASSGSQSMT